MYFYGFGSTWVYSVPLYLHLIIKNAAQAEEKEGYTEVEFMCY